MIPEGLVKDARRVLEVVKSQPFIRVLGHYDADGVSSAAVISLALKRLNISFQTRILSSLSKKDLETHVRGAESCVILTDLGSSMLEELDKVTAHPVIVIDHHAMPAEVETNHLINLNAHRYNLDGATEVSSSMLAFAIAILWDEKNWDLINPALIGAIGDKQTVTPPCGLNRYLIDEAKKQTLIEERQELAIDSGPLDEALTYAIDPHFPSIADTEGASAFLKKLGIDPTSSFSGLDKTEKRKLTSFLILGMASAGCDPEAIRTSVRRRYIFSSANLYADHLTRVIDSCGRSGMSGIGLVLACGCSSSRAEAESITIAFKKKVHQGITYLKSGGIATTPFLYYFRWDDPTVAGILAEVATLYLGKHDKPVFGIATSGANLKISSRTTHAMVRRNVNLSEVCRGAAEACGGTGGGHNIAAGATIPASAIEMFLTKAGKIIEAQVSGQKP